MGGIIEMCVMLYVLVQIVRMFTHAAAGILAGIFWMLVLLSLLFIFFVAGVAEFAQMFMQMLRHSPF